MDGGLMDLQTCSHFRSFVYTSVNPQGEEFPTIQGNKLADMSGAIEKEAAGRETPWTIIGVD